MSPVMPAVAAEETFDGTWPFLARYSDAPDFRMHFITETWLRAYRVPFPTPAHAAGAIG